MEISSNQFNPRVIEQTTSSVTIAWDQVSSDAEVYKVERHHKTGEWTRVFWGSEPPAKVENLEENFGYKFRIVALKLLEPKGYEPISVSKDFVGTTISSLPSNTVLFRSIRKSEQFLAKRLLHKRPSLLDLSSPNGNSPLANAIAYGEKDIFDVLLTAGASVHQRNSINKRTPLHIAFFHGQLGMSKMLVNKKANLDAQDCIGMTPSHYAVDAEQLDMLKFALENKCNKEARDNCGWTLLQRAIVMNCSLSVVKLLVLQGCRIDAVNKSGLDCVELAKISGNQDVVSYLKNYVKLQEVIQSAKVVEMVKEDVVAEVEGETQKTTEEAIKTEPQKTA